MDQSDLDQSHRTLAADKKTVKACPGDRDRAWTLLSRFFRPGIPG